MFLALPQNHGDWILYSQEACGAHGATSNGIPYIVLPYGYDSVGPCGSTYLNPNDSVSENGGHELAETITDPLPFGGWYDYVSGVQNPNMEIADLCAGYAAQPTSLSGTSFDMYPLYSNNAGQCWMTQGVGPPRY